jgi:hypothetical protein
MATSGAPIFVAPLTAPLDARSAPTALKPNVFVWKQNLSVSTSGNLMRCRGYLRPYEIVTGMRGESDFYAKQKDNPEPITFLYNAVRDNGQAKLLLGTRSRLAVLNESNGQWTILGNSFGSGANPERKTTPRFRAATLHDKVLLTNNYDSLLVYNIATDSLTPLSGAPFTRAAFFYAWRGFMFAFNTTEGGQVYSSRVRWSDLNNPTVWSSGGSSLADFQDLDYGEEILNVAELGGYLHVFTDKSIYRCALRFDSSISAVLFEAQKVYTEPTSRLRCLRYPNTLVSDGFTAYYLGDDDIYTYSPNHTVPESPEWLHGASEIIFRIHRIDQGAVLSPVAAFCLNVGDPSLQMSNEIHISWPTTQYLSEDRPAVQTQEGVAIWPTKGLNNHTLVLNLTAQTADYRDYGMSAYVNWTPSPSNAIGPARPLFIGASTKDFGLKRLVDSYVRLHYDENGNKRHDQYESILRGELPLADRTGETRIVGFSVYVEPEDPTDPGEVTLRIGVSAHPYDPNAKVTGSELAGYPKTSNCSVVWHTFSSRRIACQEKIAPADMPKLGVRQSPVAKLHWRFSLKGRYVYYELVFNGSCGGFNIHAIEAYALSD